jgi:hypothetical protein
MDRTDGVLTMTEAAEMTIDDLRELDRERHEQVLALPPEPPPVNWFEAIIPPRGAYPCRGGCPARLELPGLCPRCAAVVARAERDRRVRAWAAKALPERYRDANWSSLPKLPRDDGSGRPRVELSPERLAQIRAALETHRRVVFIGPPGCGKTTIAVAHLRAAVERDPDARVRFTPAEDLLREETPEGGPTPLALALSAEVLVVDDLGVELNQAPVGSGLLAQRAGAASKLIGDRFDRQRPLVVTTGLDQKAIQTMYGDRIARRLFEGAAAIRLGAGAKRTAA